MSDEIEAAFDRLGHVGLAHGLVRARRCIDVHRGLVNRRLYGVGHRQYRFEIRDDGVNIRRREDLVETVRHDRRDLRAVRSHAGEQ